MSELETARKPSRYFSLMILDRYAESVIKIKGRLKIDLLS